MPQPSTNGIAVNPLEGQVKIPLGQGWVVGRLGARAMRWVEEQTGRTIDDIYTDVARRAVLAQRGGDVLPSMPVAVAVAVIWAAVEHERRLQGLPGPEFTLDDADAVIETVGLDDAYNYALALIQLSVPFKKRSEEIDRQAEEAGEESPLAELRRVAATGGTGSATSSEASPPASPSTSSGI